jgi:hypothetical protein
MGGLNRKIRDDIWSHAYERAGNRFLYYLYALFVKIPAISEVRRCIHVICGTYLQIP